MSVVKYLTLNIGLGRKNTDKIRLMLAGLASSVPPIK